MLEAPAPQISWVGLGIIPGLLMGNASNSIMMGRTESAEELTSQENPSRKCR